MDSIKQLLTFIVHRLYTHNPFYLISVALVLYGLHRSFSGETSASQGMLLMQVFCGYVVLLAAVGIVVIRWGKVWEDGRMILLIILLLFVALSMSFDEIALSDPDVGGQYLAMGFGFALLVTESILWLLGLRLPAHYRIPYYLQLAVLFAYPYQLSVWSVAANDPRMPWGMLLFPVVCALALLALWPAAHRAGRGEAENGTPWRWPLYPWTLFFFLLLGMTLRTYSVTMIFETATGGASGFLPYFLIPLLLAVCLLVLEMGLMRGRKWPVRLAMAAALASLGLAFAELFPNLLQGKYLLMLRGTVGAPPFWTVWLLAGFYAFALLRGVRLAEAGLIVCLLLAAHIRSGMLSAWSLADPWLVPHAAIVLYQWTFGVARRSTWRILFASLLALADAAYFWRDTWLLDHRGFVPLHAALIIVTIVPLLFNDWFARYLRHAASWVLGLAAIVAALYYPTAFPTAPAQWHLEYLTLLVAVAALYWLRLKRWRSIVSGAVCAGAYAAFTARLFHAWLRDEHLFKGLDWLTWGLACLIAAALISLVKAGFFTALQIRMRYWEQQWQPNDEPQDAG